MSTLDWNTPEVAPDRPGEYRAALDPLDAAATVRRFWNGRRWSNPYHSNWPQAVQAAIMRQTSILRVFWQQPF
ncbi:hypothetical protein [Ralstonia pseudosolanacearum]|uniref:hypothetical protein n=1 Tax=Ralstonia pseudosolanacearum TaxID=1310165 RepID=UPI003CF5D575